MAVLLGGNSSSCQFKISKIATEIPRQVTSLTSCLIEYQIRLLAPTQEWAISKNRANAGSISQSEADAKKLRFSFEDR